MKNARISLFLKTGFALLLFASSHLSCTSMGTEAKMKKPGGKGPITKTLSQHQRSLEACIPESISLNSGEGLRLILRFDVQESGHATNIDIERMSSPDPDFSACILKKIKRITFEPPEFGEPLHVRYPLIFEQGGT